ncbi:MAG TPA: branched-chain amino acid ABC transporter permease [Nitrososphaerales archaeon]|nr:branched-chain amino acid ABC transporter permease [Nitrososphaerales archaeon]
MAGPIPSFNVTCGSTTIDLVSVFINVGIIFCVYLIVSLSVNLEYGYTGVPNFGKVLFVAAGGLIAGALSYRIALYALGLRSTDIIASQATFIHTINQEYLPTHPYFGLELFILSLVIGAAAAAAFGFLASYPAIRLREDYLGMLLLAAGEFFRIFVTAYYPLTGGTQGLLVPDPVAWATSVLGERDLIVLIVLIGITVVIYFYSERTVRSPLGRMLRAIRDNDMASSALGKNNVGVRRNILILGSAISGIAGVLYVLAFPAISPTTFLRAAWTFYPWVIVILGGAANNVGVVIGTVAFVGVTTSIDQYRTCALSTGVSLPVDINALEPIAIGVLLLIILLWRPQGLIREKPTSTLKKSELQSMFRRTEESGPTEDVSKAIPPPDKSGTRKDLEEAQSKTASKGVDEPTDAKKDDGG